MSVTRTLDAAELARRRPVWIALSRLWLDTALDDGEIAAIAATLRAAGYPLAELERIYRREVAPVVHANSLVPAGVWDGFDPDWLCAAARRNAEAPSLATRLRLAIAPLRRSMVYAAEPDWRRVCASLQKNDAT